MSPKLLGFVPAFLVTLLLDQGSKLWTVRSLAYRGGRLEARTQEALERLGHHADLPAERVIVPNVLEFVHAQNSAAAMGMMEGVEHRLWFFGLFTLVALIALGAMFRALPRAERVQAAGLGVLLGGVLGNGIDRAHKGAVTDFIKVIIDWEPLRSWMIEAIGTNEWYTFNIADAAIFVGVGLYLLATFFTRDGDAEEDVGTRPSLEDDPTGASAGDPVSG